MVAGRQGFRTQQLRARSQMVPPSGLAAPRPASWNEATPLLVGSGPKVIGSLPASMAASVVGTPSVTKVSVVGDINRQ